MCEVGGGGDLNNNCTQKNVSVKGKNMVGEDGTDKGWVGDFGGECWWWEGVKVYITSCWDK